jgi:amino acid transporter
VGIIDIQTYDQGAVIRCPRPPSAGEQMTDRPVTAVDGGVGPVAVPGRLEPNAIGVAQDTAIGMASTAPGASAGLTLAALAATAAYASVPVIIVTAIPMLIIANSYRRLNLWTANCGASFEWVGRAIDPNLGFMTGWLMIAGYIVGAVAGVEVIGPSVLAIFTNNTSNTWAIIAIATVLSILMLIVAIVGIKISARTQVSMAAVEYLILIGLSIAGLVVVLNHRHGTFPITHQWFQLSGIGGKGSLASGLLIAVFCYSGWEGTLYVNEEVKHRRVNPGKAAVWAVAILTVIFCLIYLGLSGLVSPAKLQANSTSALVYVIQSQFGGNWAKVMAFALALSVIAATGANILLTSRIIYGMATHRVLPEFLGRVSRRYSTPVGATVLVGVLLIAITWVYLLLSSVQNAFNAVVDVSGLLFAAFYVMTGLATIAYYRRRIIASVWDMVLVGILPLAAAGFLVWIIYKSIQGEAASNNWSLVGIVALGLILLLVARFVYKSEYFHIAREAAPKDYDINARSEGE